MMNQAQKQKVCILGSTGSIGVNTLNVIRVNAECYEAFALTAKSQVDLLFRQCMEFKPSYAVMLDSAAAKELKSKLTLAGAETEVLDGIDGLNYVAGHEQVDSVMAAIVGGAGLLPTLRSAEAGKKCYWQIKKRL